MTEKIITGKKTSRAEAGKILSAAALTAEPVDIRLEVGLIEDFFWDELDNPRIQSQHEFKNDDEVVFIINITSPTAIGVDTITGYDYSDVDTECRHDWSAETDPSWNSFWIMIAADFSAYGTPIKGITADYFCSGILYAFINELNSVSDAYVIKVVECEEEGFEEIIEVCDDGTKKKWRSCEGGEWVYYEQACPIEEEEEAEINYLLIAIIVAVGGIAFLLKK